MNVTIFGSLCESLSLSCNRKRQQDNDDSILDTIEDLEELLISRVNELKPRLTSIMGTFRRILRCEICICGLFDQEYINLLSISETSSWDSSSIQFFRHHGFNKFIRHSRKALYNTNDITKAFVVKKPNMKFPDGHPLITNYSIIPLTHFGEAVGALLCANFRKEGLKAFNHHVKQLEAACILFAPLLVQYVRKEGESANYSPSFVRSSS